ncbi:MAG TPA: ATP-binding protein [Streptomyces sp.]
MELPPGTPHGARPSTLAVGFDGGPGCIAAAREAAVSFLRRHAPKAPDVRGTFHGDAVLVVSELVTNAVRHAPGAFVLELSLLAGGIEIAVHDTNPNPPQVRPPDRTGGRGWPLVQSLAHQVRVIRRSDGKAVHAELAW